MSLDIRGRTSEEERDRLAHGLGAELRRLRLDRGLSQERLGDLAGIGRWHVSDLERGTRRPSADALAALARVLGSRMDPEPLTDRLAALAGDSLRFTAPRRRRRPTNRHRLAAVGRLEQQTASARAEVRRREDVGLAVPEHLRRLAEGTAVKQARAILAASDRTSADRPLTCGNTGRGAVVSTREERRTP